MGKYLVNVLFAGGGTSSRHHLSYLLDKLTTGIVTAPTPAMAARALLDKAGVSPNSAVRRIEDHELLLQIVDLDTQQLLDNMAIFADDPRVRLSDIKDAISALVGELDRCEKTLRPLEKIKMERLDSLQSLYADLAERVETLRQERSRLEETIKAQDIEIDQLELAMLSKQDDEDAEDDDDDDGDDD